MDYHLPYGLIIFFLPIIIFLFSIYYENKSSSKLGLPKSYPLIGCTFSLIKNRKRLVQWTAQLLQNSPSSTITLTGPFGKKCVLTTNPSNVKHILKTRFDVYEKSTTVRSSLHDLLGGGIFVVDGTEWKSHRQLISPIFKSDTFHHIVECITMKEISSRLLPLFADASTTILDLPDIFRRFTFDIVFKEGFGHDPQYLSPSLPKTLLADAFNTAIKICMGRYASPSILWKAKKFARIGSEKNLSLAVKELQEFIKNRLKEGECDDHVDFVHFLASKGRSQNKLVCDEKYYVDSIINFILGAEDTLCSALIWFFWLISSNPEVVSDIKANNNNNWKKMTYLHASICESMRLYPPAPVEPKQATGDEDIWPDGTKVNKGTEVIIHIFAMGRSQENWAEFKPERWLRKDVTTSNWVFIPRDPFNYLVFQAGPRTCLGIDIAFMQIKLVAANVLSQFQLVPAVDGYSPVYTSTLTSKMKNGFPVRVIQRV
ncbi:cytochrome P450 94A1-like [Solanum tuberosum]|uniref:Cytochrome P450-dependent fatty acid hydroxylase n=1 Tax=Solanum tuberosum TaxID=4113 RepID=M0ZQY5_SOLTU|nr:PREDICTED: cytochrome P450 94A1-like [Solanum tuberosum]